MWIRIKTALILVLIVGVALFASETPYLFVPLLAAGIIIASHEWTKLMPKWRVPSLFVVLVFTVTMTTLLLPVTWPAWWAAAIVIWLMALSWVTKFPTSTNWYGPSV